MNLAKCFQYINGSGDLVTAATVEDYVTAIGNRTCNLVTQVSNQQSILTQLGARVGAVEAAIVSIPKYVLPSLFPTGIASQTVALPLDVFTALLEKLFVEFRNAVGSVNDISDIASLYSGYNVAKALGTTGGNLGSLSNWDQNILNLVSTNNNALVMINDLRSAVKNLQLQLIANSCNAVQIVTQGTYAARTLTLFFTGTIPNNLLNTEPGGSLFLIRDDSGGSIQQRIDIRGNLNLTGGVQFDLTGSPLNFADDLHLSGINSLTDPNTGTTCQKYISLDIVNNASCPTVSLSASYTTITYNFNHTEGTLTYYIELYSIANIMLQSRSVSVSGPAIITGQFADLTDGTTFKVKIRMVTPDTVRSCPFSFVSTLPTLCPEPNDITAVIHIT